MSSEIEGSADQAIDKGLGEAQSTLNQDFAIGVERRKEQLKLETEITKALNLQFETTRKILDFQQESITQLAKQAQQLIDNNATTEQKEKVLANIKDQFTEIADSQSISKDLADQLNEAFKDKEKGAEKVVELMEKVRGEMEQTKDFARGVDTNFSKFSRTLNMTEDFSKTGMGKLQNFFIELKTGNTAKKIEMIKDKFIDFINPMNVAANLLDMFIDQVFKLEQASIGFSKATGFAREFDGEMVSVAKNITMAGGTMDDASKSLGDLAKNMSNFATLSETAMKNLATLDFRLKQIGVTNASKMFDIFSRNLGKGADEAERLTRDLILSGTAAGITASEMATNFESSFKDLAVNGSRATEVFKDLAAQAKAAGVAISDLTALGKDFDTFDKGAEKAAKLNAILGTQISHMQMLHMSDEQRSMEMIRQVKMAVGNFDALSRSEKLYIAQAIAGGDVAKAQRLINMNTSEYLEKKDQMAAAAKTQEDMRKLTEQLVPVMERFKLAFLQAALAFSPFIEGLVFMLNVVGALAPLIKILAQLTVYYLAALGIEKLGLFVIDLYRKAKATDAATLAEKRATIVTRIKNGLDVIANALLSKRTYILLGLAAAVALLHHYMSRPGSPPFYLIFGVAAVGVFLLGRAFDTVSPMGYALGVVIAGVALSMSLLFYMIGDLVEKMIEFVKVMMVSPMALYNAAGGVYALATAMGALSLATIGFRFTAFTGFAKSIGNMGSGIEKFVGSIKSLKTIAGEISSAMGDSTLVGTVDGGKSTVALGKNSAIASIFAGDKLVVDIQMPEINFPTPVVHVYIDGVAISDAVMNVVMETQ